MITVNYLSDYASRTGFDFDFTGDIDIDKYGDYISMVDPETDFRKVRAFLLESPQYSRKIVSQGVNHVELLEDNLWIDGVRVHMLIRFEYNEGNFGTRLSSMVRSVDTVLEGSFKSFLSMEDFEVYKENLLVV